MDSTNGEGCYKVGPANQTGDVDRDGEIVDLAGELHRRAREAAAYRRLEQAICTDEAAVDVDDHLARVASIVDRAKARP